MMTKIRLCQQKSQEEDFNPTICNAAAQQTSNYVSLRQQLQPQQLLLQLQIQLQKQIQVKIKLLQKLLLKIQLQLQLQLQQLYVPL